MSPDAPALLALLHAARSATTPAERLFVLLNRTREVLPYHAAVLWQEQAGLLGHSGVSQVDAHGPYGLWLTRLLRALARLPAGRLDADALQAGDPACAQEWDHWWPPHALWLPAPEPGAPALLLVREVAWSSAEHEGLAQWAELWRLAERAASAHARRRVFDPGALWLALRRPGRTRWLKLSAAVALALLAAMPVHLTLRASGELVPREPTVLRAAIEGTVRRLAVEPNQVVQAGQVLAELDDASAASRLQVARQALATAEAEWRQTSQAALGDPKAKAQLPAAQGKLNEKVTEVRFLEQQMQRTALLAPHAGVVLIDDAGSWAGRTVQAGEPLMRLAEPQDQELEAWLAVGDAIDLPAGTTMQLHLASRPADPVPAELRLYGYEAEQRPDGSLAYRLRGKLAGPPSERLGARGTVRIQGPSEPLMYAVLRRPLAAVREATGW
ncbi:MAG: hypothetical protein RLZZ584_2358 [Pseudomonadota bacterium]